jgi:hypothetical protein
MFPNRICHGFGTNIELTAEAGGGRVRRVKTNALRDFPAPTALALDREFPSAR